MKIQKIKNHQVLLIDKKEFYVFSKIKKFYPKNRRYAICLEIQN